MDAKEIKLFESQLVSGLKDQVLSAVVICREKGSVNLLGAIVKAYKQNNDKEIQQAVFDLLCDLRQIEVAEIMVNLIESETDINVKQMLVTSCWYSNVDYSGYLKSFINLVMQSSFELAFEAFTVVENNEGRVSRKHKDDLISFIASNAGKIYPGNETLVDSLQMIIENYPE
jgi:hypothetical protein